MIAGKRRCSISNSVMSSGNMRSLRYRKKSLTGSACSIWLYAAFLLIIAVKAVLASRLYILVNGYAYHDDMLGICQAQSLIQGNWLGTYHARTLVKGIAFPVFLASNSYTGIPYTVSITVLYGIACVLLCKALKPALKKDVFLLLTFIVLFFNPANGNTSSFLRIYRNSLSPVLLLMVIAAFIEIYYSRGKWLWLTAVWAGIWLALFINNREDSFWIYPFVITATILSAVKLLSENRKNGKKTGLVLLAFVIPFLIVFLVNTGIKAENKKYYGVPYRNELSEGGFPELMKALYSIAPEEDLYRVSVTRSTVEHVREVSPTFAEVSSALDGYYGIWDPYDGSEDGQICDGWFFWCLRESIYDSYPDLSAEEISGKCAQMAKEIKNEQAAGNLPVRGGIVMPSALMSPYKKGYAKELCFEFLRLFRSAVSFSRSDNFERYRIGEPETFRMLEEMTSATVDPSDGSDTGSRKLAYAVYEKVNRVYILFGDGTFAVALICWCAMLVFLFRRKHGFPQTADAVLFAFGFIASAAVYLLGASYTHISAFSTDNVGYLSAVYPLFSAFCCVSIFGLLNEILTRRKQSERGNDGTV